MFTLYDDVVAVFEGKRISKENKHGDCYIANGKRFLDEYSTDEYLLVHGEVSGKGPLSGMNFGHCWIENEDTVFDFSNGNEIIIPKIIYYGIGNIEWINNYCKYSLEEYMKKLKEHQTWGPWDVKTKF